MSEKTFLSEYSKLDPKQKQAVNEIEGPVMVIAGPGTGKTQIIAMRVAQILRTTQVSPSNLLCLTFTNSGVQAMKQRLVEIIGPASYQIHVHTFHSFCNEVIGTFPEKFLTSKKLNQLTDLEQIITIQQILNKNNYSLIKPFKSPYHYQKAILKTLEELKQENIPPEKFKKLINQELKNFDKIEDIYHKQGAYKGRIKAKYEQQKTDLNRNLELADVYQKYQDELQSNGQYDYSDMILHVVNAFQTDPEILATYQEKYHYILVDEYQDTNSAQNTIVQILGSFYDNPNVFVVGDDEQSIFRFQGASLENILFFKDSYPQAKLIVLEHNYRSIQQILDASRVLIQNNQNQIFKLLNINKKLKSAQKNARGNINVVEFSHGSVESYFIAKKIQELVKKGVNPAEIAVLSKEHRDTEELIDFLSKLNLPYIIEIGGDILEDPEIDKIITYFKALNFDVKQIDNQLILEVLHYPYFGIATLDIYKIIVSANKARKNIFDVISSKKNLANLDLDKPAAITNFLKTFLQCRRLVNSTTFAHAFEQIINTTGYLNYLLGLNESVHHLNRLQTLFNKIKILNAKDKHLKLGGFLEYINLLEENNLPIIQRELSAAYIGIHIMTAHKAKGLEFKYIFLIHVADKHWGNKAGHQLIKLPLNLLKTKSSDDENDEEERRLFYVALTRAKRHIFLSYALAYGDPENPVLSIPSKFLSEIPPKYLRKLNPKKYEDQFDKRLKLTFAKKKWQPSEALEDYLKQLIKDFRLSPTALNSYLKCPQRFFYDNILRVPKTKDRHQSYGTAVHTALELLFKKYKRDFKLPSKKEFLADFDDAMKEEIFTDADYANMLRRGRQILSAYYDFYANDWRSRGVPLATELNFLRDNVFFGDIPLTGKIDRLDLIDKISNTVRIVDYKTSSPKSLNYLLGQTREKNTDYLYQAYFYQLLADEDPNFRWQVGEIEFDFVTPEKRGDSDRFKRVILPIDTKQYIEFKKNVEQVYAKILNQDFHLEEPACKDRKENCPYYNICHTGKKN